MILLDTDHLTVLSYPADPRYARLTERMRAPTEEAFATTVVSLEEQMRGWLAAIKQRPDVHEQVAPYQRLARLFAFYRDWEIVPFDDRAADEFKRMRKQRVRIGTQDLKIASITLVQQALLLSANLRDFQAVPELKVENWLD